MTWLRSGRVGPYAELLCRNPEAMAQVAQQVGNSAVAAIQPGQDIGIGGVLSLLWFRRQLPVRCLAV